MAQVAYRCPVTGERIEIWLVEDEPARTPSSPHVRVQCPACSRTHIVNVATGIAGDHRIGANIAT